MHNDENHREGMERVRKLIDGIEFAMLTTEEEDGHLRSRPMATLELDEDGALWFFTGAGSHKMEEIDQHRQVNLAYMDKEHSRYVSISGRAELVHDKEKIESLWKPVFKAWFPDGLEDPDLALLKVSVERAEYWDPMSSKVTQAFGFVKALVTGKRAEPEGHGRFSVGEMGPAPH